MYIPVCDGASIYIRIYGEIKREIQTDKIHIYLSIFTCDLSSPCPRQPCRAS